MENEPKSVSHDETMTKGEECWLWRRWQGGDARRSEQLSESEEGS